MSPATPPPRRPSAGVQLLAVIRKEMEQTGRDRRVLAMLLVAPLLQLVIFGFAVDFAVDRVPTVVVDHDQTAASRLHARRLLADGTLLEVARVSSDAEASRLVEDNVAAAIVVLPPGLEKDLMRRRPAEVQVVLDGTDPNRATVAAAAASRYFGEVGLALIPQGAPRPARLELSPRVLFNPLLATPPFMVPAVMAMLLLLVTTIVTAMGLAREREMGTLEQVLVTPIRPLVLLVGKMTPFAIIGLVDVLVALTAGAWIFGVPVRGSLLVLFAATLLYLLSTLGVGLFISSFSRTQQQAFLGGFVFMLPAILLSGAMTPIRAMPTWLRWVTWLDPLRFYMEVLRANLLKGAGFVDVAGQLAALAVFGTAILAVAAVRFRKTTA